MTTFDEVLVKSIERLHGQGEEGWQAVLRLAQHHAHARLDVSLARIQAKMNSKTNYGLEEAGMAQMDDSVGAILKHIEDIGETDNTIVVFTTDNGAEVFTWPDGGMTPFKATKGTVYRRRLPRAVHRPLAGAHQAGHGRERHLLRARLVPHAVAAAGNPEHHRPAAQGREARRPEYKNHLDGYNQMDLLRAKGHPSATSCGTSAARSWGRAPRRLQVPVLPAAGEVGPGRRSQPTCPAWSTSARIRSSGRHRPAARH